MGACVWDGEGEYRPLLEPDHKIVKYLPFTNWKKREKVMVSY